MDAQKKKAEKNFLIGQKIIMPIFTGMIIPNVFGPFGNPYYNSVVATFSHQLVHNELPNIETDGNLKLIYIGELIEEIWKIIKRKKAETLHFVNSTAEAKVSEILEYLESYKIQYFENSIIPEIHNRFELNLFNTFRSYFDHSNYFPVLLKKNS